MTSSDQFTIKIRRDGTIFQYNSKFELINTWIGFQDSRCLHLSIANDTLIALAVSYMFKAEHGLFFLGKHI